MFGRDWAYPRPYSFRKATIGSTRPARQAGTKLAATATAVIRSTVAVIDNGSTAPTPKKRDAIRRATTSAAGTPRRRPAKTVVRLSRITIRYISDCLAPNAVRIPNSRVRRARAYAIVPYTPMHTISNARPLAAVERSVAMCSSSREWSTRFFMVSTEATRTPALVRPTSRIAAINGAAYRDDPVNRITMLNLRQDDTSCAL